jgi:membrane-bound lytic murein transglycosylase A
MRVMTASKWVVLALVMVLASGVSGCRRPIEQAPAAPDYNRPLMPGEFGLRQLPRSQWPDLGPAAQQMSDPAFREALDRSLRWYSARSSRQFFPSGPISHDHAHYSAHAIRTIADEAASPSEALAMLESDFDVWESIGWNRRGDVLYTAYFTPVFTASRTPDATYRYPLYRRPSDLRSDPVTGRVLEPYPSRAELEQGGRLSGLELVYLPSRLDAYIIEVNGSAKLNIVGGGEMYVGFAGTNGHDYVSIRKLMVQDGVLDEHTGGLPAMRAYFRQNPGTLEGYIRQNPRFVFFREYDSTNWPAGSMGFRVTPMRSIATDKDIFPRGSVVFTNTTIPTADGGTGPFHQLMVDQDTGGAIRAAGRADIYIGIGDQAEAIAGRQAANGKMYYLLLKPERVQTWHDHAQRRGGQAAGAVR